MHFFDRQIATAYVSATTGAMAVALGLNSLVKVCRWLLEFLSLAKIGIKYFDTHFVLIYLLT